MFFARQTQQKVTARGRRIAHSGRIGGRLIGKDRQALVQHPKSQEERRLNREKRHAEVLRRRVQAAVSEMAKEFRCFVRNHTQYVSACNLYISLIQAFGEEGFNDCNGLRVRVLKPNDVEVEERRVRLHLYHNNRKMGERMELVSTFLS